MLSYGGGGGGEGKERETNEHKPLKSTEHTFKFCTTFICRCAFLNPCQIGTE